ncbi:MAG: UvrD-helicase domain-containing protein [Gammaproteobacteria bacterium]
MNESLKAADPSTSACVLASAGTGKTWLLVARLVRLLLAGAAPERLLAITFTRKAANEMQVRLQEKLQEFLTADDAALDKLLAEIGELANEDMRTKARSLFEIILFSEQPLRTTTFHSFCHDLLKRFPLEADLPPGFELIETTGLLFEQSWDALFASATRDPASPLAERLNRLFFYFASPDNTQKSLFSFLKHRSDWWAYTLDQSDPARYAEQRLAREMGIRVGVDLAAEALNEDLNRKFYRFAELLSFHSTQTNLKHSDLISQALELSKPNAILATLEDAFLIRDGKPRARKHSATLEKKLGNSTTEFLDLHQEISQQLIDYKDEQVKLENYQASADWYYCGAALLESFQSIKRNRRLVDFTDLEWKAHQLLNHSEQAQWVHYKLDQNIDHLLIDEFQDTNPTQWQLLQPLINELSTDEHRSLFLVGDAKQSIYRFRRGDPALLKIASDHMIQHLNAKTCCMDASWRSSPAIMEAVNRIFSNNELSENLENFTSHKTNLDSLWGQVEVWPVEHAPVNLDALNPSDITSSEFRNPLETPRIIDTYNAYAIEANRIAEKIESLISESTIIGDEKQNKYVDYNDIIILLRSRTHLPDYEHALRQRKIPYLGMDRGTLLNSLEVRDLESLLNLLMTPHNNLALAQVLKSPIFSASDDDLVLLAQSSSGPWIDQLETLTNKLDELHPLSRAHHLLSKWRKLVGHIPIHDLLDMIYHDTHLIARYLSAFPEPLRPRISANLTSFIELALSIDSGRYPSLPHFLNRLQKLKQHSEDAPSESPPESKAGQRVRIMTIHSAKGLEAPVVFLADCAKVDKNQSAWSTLIDWPATETRPHMLALMPSKDRSDTWSKKYLEKEQALKDKDSANLLYVALTRAKQMLFISGSPSKKGKASGWHEKISAALRNTDDDEDTDLHLKHGNPPVLAMQQPLKKNDAIAIDPALSQPVTLTHTTHEIAPSLQDPAMKFTGTGNGQLFGQAVHRLLQLQIESLQPDSQALSARVARELNLSELITESASKTVDQLLQNKDLHWVFYPDEPSTAWNEAPIEYLRNGYIVSGFIDRLILGNNEVHIIDYKSHQIDDKNQVPELTNHYRNQLKLYREGVERLWPDKAVKSWLLFTSISQLVEID